VADELTWILIAMHDRLVKLPAEIADSLPLVLVSVIVFLIGLFCALRLIPALRLQLGTKTWVPTPCEIIAMQTLEPEYVGRMRIDWIHLTFSYTYEGKKHCSQWIYHDTVFTEKDDRLAKVIDAGGAEQKCYVNPAKPDEAVLLTGMDCFLKRKLFVPAVMLVLFLITLPLLGVGSFIVLFMSSITFFSLPRRKLSEL
jgi:hypothetical protein